MWILEEIVERDIVVDELSFVSETGSRYGWLNLIALRETLNWRFHSIHRSDLASIIHDAITPNSVRYIFGNSIQEILEDEDGVSVVYREGGSEKFDLVIGADWLHSRVRRLIFWEEEQFEHFMWYYVSSYTTDNILYLADKGMSCTVPWRQTLIYPIPGDRMTVVYILKSDKKLIYDRHNREEQEKIVIDAFSDVWPYWHMLNEKLHEADDFYFDTVSQIHMSNWTKWRVALVWDACACPSLLSGQWSTLAMVGSYILAWELYRSDGDYTVAFSEYEKLFMSFITLKQKNAQKLARSFVPKSWFWIWLRDFISSHLFSPLFPKKFLMEYLTDNQLKITDYKKDR